MLANADMSLDVVVVVRISVVVAGFRATLLLLSFPHPSLVRSHSNSRNFDIANFLKWFSYYSYSFGNSAPEIYTHTPHTQTNTHVVCKLLYITVNKSFSIGFLLFSRHLLDKLPLTTAVATAHINCQFFFSFFQTQLVESYRPIRRKIPFRT